MFFYLIVLLYTILALLINAFFFPLPWKDSQNTMRYRSAPWMTYSLMAANILVFMAWQAPDIYKGQGDVVAYVDKIWRYGYRSSTLRDHESIGAWVTLTSIFMHGDLSHLTGNMIYLRAFGYRVEDACGPWRYLGFYLFAGMMANIGEVVFDPQSQSMNIPTIGASGAISGVLGAYLILFYTEKITCIWGLGTIFRVPVALLRIVFTRASNVRLWTWTVALPAWTLLIAFLVMNTVPSFEIIQQEREVGGVAYLAHFIGFLSGLAIFLFVRRDLLLRYAVGRAL